MQKDSDCIGKEIKSNNDNHVTKISVFFRITVLREFTEKNVTFYRLLLIVMKINGFNPINFFNEV
jgi:hypothetical protein